MDENTQKPYLEILELPSDASWLEITKAYNSLKQLYSKPSMATLPVAEEYSEERRQEILKEIEAAYVGLEEIFACSKKNLEKNLKSIVAEIETFSGPILKTVRERLHIALSDIALETNIQVSHLKNIENERYGALPLEIYLIGYLKNYAKCLSLEPKKVVADYMMGYLAWKKNQPDE